MGRRTAADAPAPRFLSSGPPAEAASAGGAAAAQSEPSWKVRYGVRVEQPDGGIVAGLEASLRAGLAHTASAVRRTADSLRGAGRNTPGNSVHAAWNLLAVVSEAGPRAESAADPVAADVAALPPANWPGWRAVTDAPQTPPALAALHDATAAAARAAPSAPAWPDERTESATTHAGQPQAAFGTASIQ